MKKVFIGSIVSILIGAGIIDLFGFSIVGIILIVVGFIVASFTGLD